MTSSSETDDKTLELGHGGNVPIPLIINPNAGKGRARKLSGRLVSRLKELGLNAKPEITGKPGDATNLVYEAATRSRVVLIAGGDGTVLEAVNGAMRTPARPRLGLIPMGTGNDFAKSLGIDHRWKAACERLPHAKPVCVDIGQCNELYFASSVGIGFDAQVAAAANRMRHVRGNLVYFFALLKTLLWSSIPPSHLFLTIDELRLEQFVTLLVAANGPWYGGKFKIAPFASLHDGLLDVLVAGGLSRFEILRLIPKVLRGTHLSSHAVQLYRTQHIVVDSPMPLPIHADGEIITPTTRRAAIKIISKALTFLV